MYLQSGMDVRASTEAFFKFVLRIRIYFPQMEEYFDDLTNQTLKVNVTLAQASTTELRRNTLYSQARTNTIQCRLLLVHK